MFDAALQVAPMFRRYPAQIKRALPGGIAVHIHSRLSILILVVVIATTWTVTAAARPGVKPHHSGKNGVENAPAHDGDSNASPRDHEADKRLDRDGDRRENRRERSRRACRHKSRRGVPGGCYFADDQWVEDYYPDDTPPAAQQKWGDTTSLAPITPVPTQSGLHVIPTTRNDPLKEELIAARRNWLEKKRLSDDADAARARAEYQAEQNGGDVDPALIARQDQAQSEAAEAQTALGPLVERAREAGFPSEVLDLYEKANRGY
jgi:hypothetical protein